MKHRYLIGLTALIILALFATSCVQPAAAPQVQEVTVEVTRIVEVPAEGGEAAPPTERILDTVQSRGQVVCGIHTSLPGFGYLDADGRNAGFDIDMCRAVAVAVFNDPEAVEFVPVNHVDEVWDAIFPDLGA